MATPAAHTLRKTERLCGKKDISTLFSKGKWGATAHLRYCWASRCGDSTAARKNNEDGTGHCQDGASAASRDTIPNRLLVSVSKRYFKRAVKRNLLKRRMREAYRLQKELLDCQGVDFLLSWTSKEVGDWTTVREEVAEALTRIDKAVARQRGALSSADGAKSAAEQPSGEPDEATAHNDSGK